MVILANSFSARGYPVDLVLARAEGPYLIKLSDYVRVIDLKASRVLYSLPGLVRYLKKERPAAMLSAMFHANIVALWSARLSRFGGQVVVSIRSTLSTSTKRSKSFKTKLLSPLTRLFYPGADSIIAVSRGAAFDLVKRCKISKDKVKVIYNPVVDIKLYEMAQSPIVHPWFIKQSIPVILGVGRLTKAKNFNLLIKAFSLVLVKRNVRLVILGDGEERSSLERLIMELGLKEYVALLGFVDNPFQYMSRSRVFVLSSAWEGLPGVLIQAMACGAPVVSTDCPSGPREILENGKWGRLVPVADVKAMAEAIIATLDQQKYPDVRIRASDFGVEQAVEQYLQVLLPR
jgi:glycosyltransferase involved in cell wall biosynthesis